MTFSVRALLAHRDKYVTYALGSNTFTYRSRASTRSAGTAEIRSTRMADARRFKGFRVYCDESNTEGGKPYPVYGAILIPLDHIVEVQRQLKAWRHREGVYDEVKWNKVSGSRRLATYKSLVDLLFTLAKQRELLHFKAIVLDRHAPEYRTYSKGDDELGFYKFYYHWLLRYFAKFPLLHRCQLKVIIDERPAQADSLTHLTRLKYMLNNGIRKELDATATDVVTDVQTLNSKHSDLLQAADVLMGAIGFQCQGFHLRPNANKEKVELARYLAARLGLRDLKHETNPIKETLKIVRWHWSSRGPKPRYRRRPADNPRHHTRRPNRNK
jgi:hypothetical protein